MKRIVFIIGFAFAFLWILYQSAESQFYTGHRAFSVLGPGKDAIIEQAASTSTVVVTSTASVSSQVPSSTGRYAIDIPTTTLSDQAGDQFLKYLDDSNFFHYSTKRWINLRTAAETGRNPGEQVIVSSGTRRAPPQLPPGLSVELPYESQLSISGRKTIGVGYKTTMYRFPDPVKRINTNAMTMDQQLQVRIKGQVGRKINVNVDFDDTTADKRDISVVYKGDPEEVVQEAAFGDITMSLPSTEFVGYSKQLFGVKIDAKPTKNLHTWGFFSRTKGFSEAKRFIGNTQLNRTQISDTSYIPMKYYNLLFPNIGKVKTGSVRVLRDDRISTNNNITTSTGTLVETYPGNLGASTTYYVGDFDQLVPGQDFTVDYERGFIFFKMHLNPTDVIAVDYQKDDGTWLSAADGLLKIIKDENNNPSISTEMKTFYSLGNIKIIRDDGRGNFLLKIQDLNNNTLTGNMIDNGDGTFKTVPVYPETNPNVPGIVVDFDSGIFYLDPPNGRPFHDALYTQALHKYSFLTEYHYRNKFITLRPGIVPQSERITLNGRTITRDQDYFIDYDAGLVTFINDGDIREDTVIDINYDYAPFGSAGGSTLVGLRTELAATKNISLGSSYIYDFAAQSVAVPDIRTTPSSLQVWEGDAKVASTKVPGLPLTAAFGGEYASSKSNPNIMGKAIVESMEGVKLEDDVSLYDQNWHPASNPSGLRYFLGLDPANSSRTKDIFWQSVNVPKKELYPNNDRLTGNDQQQCLSVEYDLTRSTEVSIIQPISSVGIDYSKKSFLEVWINGDGKGEQLLISYGSLSEDVDGTGGDHGMPKTEDKNLDGTLNAGEDVGWKFINPDGTSYQVGNNNAKLDTEDLDGNGVLSTADQVAGEFGMAQNDYFRTATDESGVPYTAVTWTGWKYFKIPLNITPDQMLDWRSVKQVRLTLRASGAGQVGAIRLAKLGLTGNKFDNPVSSVLDSTITVTAINTIDDAAVYPLGQSLLVNSDYQSLYGITSSDDLSTRKEQALSMKYEINASSAGEASTRILYGQPYDYSNYHNFKLFVYAKDSSDTFFIQIGNDQNYFEYSEPVNWVGWKLITIQQKDLTGDSKPDRWISNGGASSSTVVGSPSFQNISQIRLGVRTGPGVRKGEIWIDELFVTDTWIKEGYAWRANADFTVPNWAAFGMKRKLMNRNFETFSAGVYNRDSYEDSGYLNLNKVPGLNLLGINVPVNSTLSRSIVTTPSVVQNQGNLVSIQDEGRVINYAGSASSNLSISRYLPNVGANYTQAISDAQDTHILQNNQTATANASYSLPMKVFFLPTDVAGDYSINRSYLWQWKKIGGTDGSHDSEFLGISALGNYLSEFKTNNYQLLDTNEGWSAKAPFQFINLGNVSMNFSPAYSYKQSREDNKLINSVFDKNKSQSVSASSSLRLARWFAPNVSFTSVTNETYDITYDTTITPAKLPSQTKAIDRNAATEVSLNLNASDLSSSPYLKSLGLTSSFRMQDSDSYDGIPSSFTAIGLRTKDLWIRDNRLDLTNSTTNFIVRSVIRHDEIRLSGRYNPFEALNLKNRLEPLRSITTNITYNGITEQSLITGTTSESRTIVWPDMVVGMKRLERMLHLDPWVTDSNLNLNYRKKTSERVMVTRTDSVNYGTDLHFFLFKKYDLGFNMSSANDEDTDLIQSLITRTASNMAWGGQAGANIGKWRMSLRYDNSQNWSADGTGKLTADMVTNTYTSNVNLDTTFPRGIPIPFTKRMLALTNRIVFGAILKYSSTSSSLNVDTTNKDTYSANFTTDYEVSANFRASFGLGWSMVKNRVVTDPVNNDDLQTLDVSGRLTIQF